MMKKKDKNQLQCCQNGFGEAGSGGGSALRFARGGCGLNTLINYVVGSIRCITKSVSGRPKLFFRSFVKRTFGSQNRFE